MKELYPAVYAILIAFVVNIVLCPVLIPYLTRLRFGQPVRDDGPKTHLKKAGTPTMGGLMIILSFFVPTIFLFGFYETAYWRTAFIVLVSTLAFGVLGFMDDYTKVVRKRSLGLRAYQKIIGQLVISSFVIWFLMTNQSAFFTGSPTEIIVPFMSQTVDLGIFYIPFVFIVILGTTNGVNLTDGLDGLASGVTVLVVTFFLFMAWIAGSPLLPFTGAAVGSLLGFLLFNSHPARVIMGDTGSLALGGFVAVVAILLKMPLFIIIVGGIYVIESLSVMIQVNYYKLTKKRVFKMAPIHHSFEMSGWSETKIVALFYILTAMFCLVGFLAVKS